MSSIISLNLTNTGSRYDSAPSVIIALPQGTPSLATATATMDGLGKISGAVVTNPGSYYITQPQVIIDVPTDSSNKNAIASLVWDNLNKNVYSVAIEDSGKFYTSAPTVTFSDPDSLPGTLATATATIANNRVSALTLSNVGAGYTSSPTVTIAPPTGTPNDFRAQAAVIMKSADSNNSIFSVSILDSGNFYTDIPNITIDSATGTNQIFRARAAAIFDFDNKRLLRLEIVHKGKYYDSSNPPLVTIAEPPALTQLNFNIGEKITHSVGGTTLRGEVSAYSKKNATMSLIHVGADDGKYHSPVASGDSDIIGAEGSYVGIATVTDNNKIQTNSQNDIFDATASNVLLDFLDFSETNPFGDPGDA